MKTLRLILLLVAGILVVSPLSPARCSALEYCWNLSYPGMTTPPESIRVGVLDLGNGHYVLAGSAKIISVIDGKYNTFVVNGNAEMVDNVLDVSLRMASRNKISLLPGSTDALGSIMIFMRLNPVTLSGDYARTIDGTNGPLQLKGTFFDGIVTSVPCK
ncbi:MAG: hypothetical protein HQK57_05665 [Deltaproteobacteria bacterium]|nr:hypothetical protein [Deltaproteobacteria bacterium]